MEETEKSVPETTEVQPEGNEADFIEQIQQLKETTVDKAKYEKLQQDNKRLIEALAKGEAIAAGSAPAEKTPTVKELRNKLFSGEELTNLEYVKTALDLRAGLIAEGKEDPFLPRSTQIKITQDDVEAAERTARVFQECVERANGNSRVFTAELMARTKEIPNIYSILNARNRAGGRS